MPHENTIIAEWGNKGFISGKEKKGVNALNSFNEDSYPFGFCHFSWILYLDMLLYPLY